MRRKFLAAAITLAGFACGTSTAHAVPVFADDFESATPALNQAPPGWEVTNGTVDIVGPGLDANLCNGSGTCIDLDGSTFDAGVLQRSVMLQAGIRYVLSFDLAGNRRASGTETGRVSLGDAALDYSLADSQVAYQRFSLAFAPIVSGTFAVSFANDGADLGGAILDNVQLDTVALDAPGTTASLALALFGIAAFGSRARRASGARH
jgi:hypothetical protein